MEVGVEYECEGQAGPDPGDEDVEYEPQYEIVEVRLENSFTVAYLKDIYVNLKSPKSGAKIELFERICNTQHDRIEKVDDKSSTS